MTLLDTAQLLGNVGEFVGGILIVVTLIYLAMQIRQNSDLIKVNGAAINLQVSNSMVTTITCSRENAEYWLKGDSAFESLDEVDRVRLIFHESIGIISWNYAFELRQSNLLSDAWHRIQWQIQTVSHRQSVREAWQWCKGGFGQPFQDFINKNLGLPTS